jgi:hypothetical protein
MCTHPVLPGTGRSRHVAPPSSEIITELVSRSPTHARPGVATQWNTGSSQRPDGSVTGGWRTKTPPLPVAGNRVRGADQLTPLSPDTRRRTSAVSWWPARCAV